jgi:hypothetical protein
MKTYIATSINQNGDKHFYYPKAKSVEDAIEKSNKECIRISNDWNTWVTLEAELFSMKKHSRD